MDGNTTVERLSDEELQYWYDWPLTDDVMFGYKVRQEYAKRCEAKGITNGKLYIEQTVKHQL